MGPVQKETEAQRVHLLIKTRTVQVVGPGLVSLSLTLNPSYTPSLTPWKHPVVNGRACAHPDNQWVVWQFTPVPLSLQRPLSPTGLPEVSIGGGLAFSSAPPECLVAAGRRLCVYVCVHVYVCGKAEIFRDLPPLTPSCLQDPQATPGSLVPHGQVSHQLRSEDRRPGSGWPNTESPCASFQPGGPQTHLDSEVGRGRLQPVCAAQGSAGRGTPFSSCQLS